MCFFPLYRLFHSRAHTCSSMITALTVRYLTKRYIGEYRSKTDLLYRQVISLDSCLLDVEIVDVSAENENEFPVDQIQWADSCLIVYSITDRNSFKYATKALGNLKSMQCGVSAYLIANKADLDHLREVSNMIVLLKKIFRISNYYRLARFNSDNIVDLGFGFHLNSDNILSLIFFGIWALSIKSIYLNLVWTIF